VYNNTIATVLRQIQPAENSTPAVVISTEAVSVGNVIVLVNMTSEVALEKPEIGCTDQNIPMDTNCTDDELHYLMPGHCGDYEDESDESDLCDAIPTACRQRWPTTILERIESGTSEVNGYEGEDGHDADDDADDVDEASKADDRSTQNVEG